MIREDADDLLTKVRNICKEYDVEFFFAIPGASTWSITACEHLKKISTYHKKIELVEERSGEDKLK